MASLSADAEKFIRLLKIRADKGGYVFRPKAKSENDGHIHTLITDVLTEREIKQSSRGVGTVGAIETRAHISVYNTKSGRKKILHILMKELGIITMKSDEDL